MAAPDPRQHVVMMIGTLTTGGAEQVLIDTALGIDREKYRVTVVSLGDPAEYDFKLQGTHVKHLWLRKRPGIPPCIILPSVSGHDGPCLRMTDRVFRQCPPSTRIFGSVRLQADRKVFG